MALAIIALGSNLGDRAGYIAGALDSLKSLGLIKYVSKIYETPPEGYEDQDNFLNALTALETNRLPLNLLESLHEIENKFGRERTFKNAPRTLDLDLIFYEDFKMQADKITLPHPRWAERDFVISPMLDLLDAGIFADKKFENLRLFLSSKKRQFSAKE